MRPQTLTEVVGQSHILGEGKILSEMLKQQSFPSIVFWGPPGTGKTTLANLIAQHTALPFVRFSAVTSGIPEIKSLLKEVSAKKTRIILFVDEIHRFNKLQQDAFLPYIEKGDLILIGATTENPSFELNSALLSRLKVLKLDGLSEEDILLIVKHALSDTKKGLGNLQMKWTDTALNALVIYASGDARRALNVLEMVVMIANEDQNILVDETYLQEVLQKRIPRYDKKGEQHYDYISALHKSLRGSDADAALYYLACMIGAGEDPLYIARRLLRFSSEDVGLADPFALVLANNVFQSCQQIGFPECDCILAELVIYLALAPKSISSYQAIKKAIHASESYPSEEIPLHIRNAPTPLMKSFGYGKDYVYPPDQKEEVPRASYLPERLKDLSLYHPMDRGKESYFKERWLAIQKRLGKI
ncbi:MAG TPA: replication-associated recombination protein A [Caldisericia bacterium]|nr:replication-associated recombination protein A [Caldisericia bacterium]